LQGASHDKIVVITRKTPLEELVERFGTTDQARFYIESMGLSFEDYEEADTTYRDSVSLLRWSIPRKVRTQWIDRSFLPAFMFGRNDLVVTLGQDGLVVNTAKYLSDQPVLAFNPDPARFDGILLPFRLAEAASVIPDAVMGSLPVSHVTMARATLNDGQELLAVNDLFIGHASHGSARYLLEFDDRAEEQSSSGIIVSTGAGSTGWYSSTVNGANGIVRYNLAENFGSDTATALSERLGGPLRLDWETKGLLFTVREPFVSQRSFATIVHGRISPDQRFRITSRMPQSGVIFSDGVENDYLAFNSGSVAEIGLAPRQLKLYMPHTYQKQAIR
jgi:NAD kinase